MDAKAFIKNNLGNLLDESKVYPTELPEELKNWYCYLETTGHVIMAILKDDYSEEVEMSNYLVPCPVKAVMRDYEIRGGFVVVDLNYEPQTGLIVKDGDVEF